VTISRSSETARSVFINCPFDDKYTQLFDAIVFSVMACRFVARCALEIDDGSEVRIEKIFKIVAECRLGIHDLSRTELDAEHLLPRFNMPLELGIFLGAKRFGGTKHRSKTALILDTDRFRYQKFISDIAGQDIKAHGGQVDRGIGHIRDWLLAASEVKELPGADAIAGEYSQYLTDLPRVCAIRKLNPAKLTFNDKTNVIYIWLNETRSR
jgi:hypothetical protein